ncbi:glycosyltransferase [Paenibacillus sp. LMG 31460]|uniref:Glycosyltransferase n=1 Tax=Paenibacillus germinis TaxID=2654979 RepID=A0ABX1Z3U2_9BACL|nr:glycosyltransferase [Paenibacillus germinis]NOU87837.1 glycosyltransferase [Paenibacillus germinis]
MSKVSVVVPIYNAGKKLDKCIKSILNQTFSDFELILVNDGSTDNISLEICNKYEKQDVRIIIINQNNKGSIATRKKGIEVSTSEYVMFVDADDWIDSKTIQVLYNGTTQNNADITICNICKVLGQNGLIKKVTKSWYFDGNKLYEEDEIKRDLASAYFHGHPFPSSLCAKLFKRDLLLYSGKYLENIKFLGDDLFYNLEMLLKAKRIKMINEPLYFYRHGGFTSRFQPYLFDDMINGYQIQKQVIEEYYQDTKEKHHNGISFMLLNTFKTCLQNLFNSELNSSEIRAILKNCVSDESLQECILNVGALRHFPEYFMNAIKNQDVEYLYYLGERLHIKNKPRKCVLNLLSRIS